MVSPYSERNLVQVICVSLPLLDCNSAKVPPDAHFAHVFTQVACFEVTPDSKLVMDWSAQMLTDVAGLENMLMAMQLYSCVRPDADSLRLFLVVGFEDGSVQWQALTVYKLRGALQARHQLVWELPRLHAEPILAVAVSEDSSAGFSVSADGKLARFGFDYSGIEVPLDFGFFNFVRRMGPLKKLGRQLGR